MILSLVQGLNYLSLWEIVIEHACDAWVRYRRVLGFWVCRVYVYAKAIARKVMIDGRSV